MIPGSAGLFGWQSLPSKTVFRTVGLSADRAGLKLRADGAPGPIYAACEAYWFEQRWPDGFICPKCGGTGCYHLHGRREYVCKHCHWQSSVTAGTVLHRTHLPLTIWFWAIHLSARDKRGISAVQLSSELEIAYSSAWYLLHRLRSAMGQRDQDYVLSGIVELDDAYFGTPKSNGKRGCGTEKTSATGRGIPFRAGALASSKYRFPSWMRRQCVPLSGVPFILAAKSTATPSGLFVPRCVRGTPTITRSLKRAAALCAG